MLSNLLKGIFNRKSANDLNLKELPSQGLFYKDGFNISIKKAELEDIVYYEENYKEDSLNTISLIKDVVKKNSFLPPNFGFEDISSIDVVYIFFEIVKLTTGKEILIYHTDESILFETENFNYFKISPEDMDNYDNDSKDFLIGGFRFKLPTIGVESSITNFISESAIRGTLSLVGDKSYDFMYFLGSKTDLSYDEIENLLTIFNEELGEEEKGIVSAIIGKFSHFNRYTLKTSNGNVVEMGQLDLSKIWS